MLERNPSLDFHQEAHAKQLGELRSRNGLHQHKFQVKIGDEETTWAESNKTETESKTTTTTTTSTRRSEFEGIDLIRMQERLIEVKQYGYYGEIAYTFKLPVKLMAVNWAAR